MWLDCRPDMTAFVQQFDFKSHSLLLWELSSRDIADCMESDLLSFGSNFLYCSQRAKFEAYSQPEIVAWEGDTQTYTGVSYCPFLFCNLVCVYSTELMCLPFTSNQNWYLNSMEVTQTYVFTDRCHRRVGNKHQTTYRRNDRQRLVFRKLFIQEHKWVYIQIIIQMMEHLWNVVVHKKKHTPRGIKHYHFILFSSCQSHWGVHKQIIIFI